LDSLQASLPYYRESHRLAFVNLGKETILASDLLNADAQLLKIQNALSDASDRVASASEKLNDLMSRDVHTQFRVAAISDADNDSRHTRSHGSPRSSKPARCEEGEGSGAASQLKMPPPY
jgi:outer membrane protein TolC